MTIRPLILLTALLPVMASGDDDGVTGPSYPDVEGSYATTYAFALDRVDNPSTFTVNCAGNLAVTEQTRSSLSGSSTIQDSDDCQFATGSLSGTVEPNGDLVLVLDTPDADPNRLPAVVGCGFTSAASELDGTYAAGSVTATLEGMMSCFIPEDEGETQWSVDMTIEAAK